MPPNFYVDLNAAQSALARISKNVANHQRTRDHDLILDHISRAYRATAPLRPLLIHWAGSRTPNKE